jgi:1-acyl-sn-glycerol-3-phosphate acyltransferase
LDRPQARAEGESARERDSRVWRILVTGGCFAVFGLGGLVMGLVVFPLVLLLPGSPARRRSRTRSLVQRGFRLFVWLMSSLGGLSYEFRHPERLGRPGQLIIANHPTLVDVVFIVAFTPAPACVVKAALFANPFTRRVVQAAGYISNASTTEMIMAAADALGNGDTLVMFPEGTRTRPGEALKFQRGTASVAARSARILTPVYIRCEPMFLPKFVPWYRVPPRRPHLVFEVGDDIDLASYREQPPPAASRALNDRLERQYNERLGMKGRSAAEYADRAPRQIGQQARNDG